MKSKEARRLIKFGDSSHVLSIPKDWIDKNKLEKGDLVFLHENELGELVLNSKDKELKRPEKSVILDIEDKEWRIIKREITSAYLNNFSTLKIAGKDLSKKTKSIREAIKNLPGMEIVKQTKEEIIARTFLDPEQVKYEELTTRIDIMIRSLFQDVSQMIENKRITESDLSEFDSRDEDINGLFFLSLKVFRDRLENPSLMNYSKLPETFDSWHTNFNLEYIGDRIKEIIPLVQENHLLSNPKIRNDFSEILKKIEETYLTTMKSRTNQDKELALKLATKKSEIAKECDFFSKKNYSKRGVPELCEKLKSIIVRVHSIGRRVYS